MSIHPQSAAAAPTVISTISVGTAPVGVGVNSSTNRIYVANYNSNSVSVIDGSANTVVSTISVGSEFPRCGTHFSLYLCGKWGSGTVSVIDRSTDAVVSSISVGSNPYGVESIPQQTVSMLQIVITIMFV